MTHISRVHTALRRAVSHRSEQLHKTRGSKRTFRGAAHGWKLALLSATFLFSSIILAIPAAAQTAPSITQVSPPSGAAGTSVTISGANFGTTQGSVTFNGVATTPTSWSATSIVAPVPNGATTGDVVVTVNGVASSGITFGTGSLTTARDQHTANLLSNGKVLISGGLNGASSAELYDPNTGTMTVTSSLNSARYVHTATTLDNGLVLLAGGFNGSTWLSSAELYNLTTGTFTTTGSLSTARDYHTATLLPSGKVLIAGGSNSNSNSYLASAELYDPTAGTFSPTGNLVAARIYHTATLLNNGMVLIVGGTNSSGNLASAELYNPATGTFTSTGNLNTARYLHTATMLSNGMVLITGGSNSTGYLSSAELYNPATGTFTTTGNLNMARMVHTATLLNSGLVFVAGGQGAGGTALSSAELYNPASGSFTTAGAMTMAREYYTATPLLNGKILFAGGYGNSGYLSSAELFQTNNPTVFTVVPARWSDGYAYRRTITISHAKVPNTDQTNFPVLISGTYSDLANSNNGGCVNSWNGYDIIFTSDAAGTNLLPFEQDSYSPSTGAVNYWVQVPTLSHTTDTLIYMFYGNPSVVTDQSNKSGVWGNTYKGVWHFEGNANIPLMIADSTGNGNNGTDNGPTWTAGEINAAANFGNDYVDLGRSTTLQLPGAITASAWINAGLCQTQFPQIVSYGDSTGATGYNLYLVGSTCASYASFIVGVGSWGSCFVEGPQVNNNTWHYVVGTYAGAGGAIKIYVDGVLKATTTCANQATNYGSSPSGMIGWKADNGNNDLFSGTIDEVRIGGTALSADWIATEFNNQSSPSTFFTMGPTGSAGTGSSGASITQLSPTSGDIETLVTVTGVNFGSTQGNSTITFNGTTATPRSWISTSIIVPVPSGATTGNVVVTVGGTASNGVGFTVISGLWPNGYTKRSVITISHSMVPNADHSNFPMLISGTYPDLKTTSNGGSVTNPNGYDIIFTSDAAGTSMLPFEQDAYSATTGAVNYWVQVPVLYHTTDTVLYMFYGNSSVTTDQSNKTLVWNNAYAGVWHLGNATSVGGADSTINLNDGASRGETAVPGKINGAANFNATSQYIDLGWSWSNSTLQQYGPITASAWIKASASQLTFPMIVSYGDSTGASGYNLYLYSGHAAFILNVGGWGSGYCFVQGTSALNDNNWHYAVGTYAGAGGAVRVYVDGVQQGSSTCPNTGTYYGSVPAGEIGWKLDHGSNDDFNGAIDEVRIAGTALSADWIKAEYNNQSNPSSFFSVGTANNDLTISSVSPAAGPPGTSVTITGTQFGLTQGNSTVTFGGTTASVTSWSNTSIVATVPGALSAGSVNVVVTVLQKTSNTATFTVAMPSISSLSATSGPVGTAVTISGSNFGSTQGNSTVTFNGVPASVTSWGSGSIGASVPNGASSGNVVVTVLGVPSNGVNFTVTGSDPFISSLCVLSSCVAAGSVQITGANFTSTQGTVTVGTSSATVTSWNPTTIVATLPNGAMTGNLVYVTVSSVNSNSVPLALDSVYYYFSDSLGSTRVVTDSNGNMCYDADYYPYGGERNYTNTCSQTYKFTGDERDAETGDDYAMARHYNSRIFRFLQPDPAGMASADVTNPQSWNRYTYVMNNPANATDPSGMDGCGDFVSCDSGGFGGWGGGGWGGMGGGCDWCGGSGGGPPVIPNWSGIPMPGPVFSPIILNAVGDTMSGCTTNGEGAATPVTCTGGTDITVSADSTSDDSGEGGGGLLRSFLDNLLRIRTPTWSNETIDNRPATDQDRMTALKRTNADLQMLNDPKFYVCWELASAAVGAGGVYMGGVAEETEGLPAAYRIARAFKTITKDLGKYSPFVAMAEEGAKNAIEECSHGDAGR